MSYGPGHGSFRLGGDGPCSYRLLPADTPPVRREVRLGDKPVNLVDLLLASLLLLIYCTLRREALMGLVQAVNILAIVTTLILVKRSNRVCPHHLGGARSSART